MSMCIMINMFSRQVPFLQELVSAILFSDDYWNQDIILYLTCIDVHVFFNLMCIKILSKYTMYIYHLKMFCWVICCNFLIISCDYDHVYCKIQTVECCFIYYCIQKNQWWIYFAFRDVCVLKYIFCNLR